MIATTLGVRRSGPAIAFFAYNRPHHLAKCLASMRMNPEFRETPSYFFLDGPRTAEDVPSVAEVGRIARSVAGLLDARIVERGCNWGLSRNIIDGISQVLADNESVIVVEDDLVVSSGFLRYMDHALERYRPFSQVFSVSAYNYPGKIFHVPRDYPYDTFFVLRNMCWGWGTWRSRWVQAQWHLPDYVSLRNNDSWRRSFEECGVDLPRMLDAQVHGELDSWAIRWTYAHFAHHAVCLVPVESLVNNIGADGSGVHMKPSRRYLHPTLNDARLMRFPPLVYVDPLIERTYKTVERKGHVYRAARKWLARTRSVERDRPAIKMAPGC